MLRFFAAGRRPHHEGARRRGAGAMRAPV